MNIKHFILAILLLFIGLFLSYDKVEIYDNKKLDEPTVVVSETENITANDSSNDEVNSSSSQSELFMDESTSSDNNVTQNNKKVKKESTNTKTTTKKETKTDSEKEEPKPQCSDFYESITHGKVDKLSKSACISYGNKIQNNELDEVLDYNEEHGNVKKPTISYFRCYEVVDSNCNTKGWYLHFFCNSGGCDDNKLKSLYG